MAITQLRRCITARGETLYRILEPMKVISKVKGTDENSVPGRSLVRKAGQTFLSDPTDEVDKRGVFDCLVHSSSELRHTLSLQGDAGILNDWELLGTLRSTTAESRESSRAHS